VVTCESCWSVCLRECGDHTQNRLLLCCQFLEHISEIQTQQQHRDEQAYHDAELQLQRPRTSVRLWLAHIINFIFIITVVTVSSTSDHRLPTCSIITLSDDNFVSVHSIVSLYISLANYKQRHYNSSVLVIISRLSTQYLTICALFYRCCMLLKHGIFTWFTSCRVIYVFTTWLWR